MKYLIFYILFSILSVKAENKYVVIVGGGGEPASKSETIFDDGLKKFSKYTQNAGDKLSNIDIAFNGGHSATEKIIKNKFNRSGAESYFSAQNFNSIIEKYKKLIISNKIKPGDQILLMIDSHGAMNSGGKELTHNVATTGTANDLQTLAGSSTVSLDRLGELATLAKKHHLKLAIMDMSCFSGNTQKLANENTCVISASGTKHYAWMGGDCFTENFFNQLRPGKNLEEVFLSAREDSGDKGYPMISTPTNALIVKSVYPSISPYLMYKNMEKDGATGLLNEYLFANHDRDFMCKKEQAFTGLLNLIDQVQAANTISEKFLSFEFSFKKIDFMEFKTALKTYKKLQDDMYSSFFQNQARLQEEFEINYSDSENHLKTKKYSVQELLQNNYDNLLKQEKESPNGSKMLISLYTSLKMKKSELLAKSPGIKKMEDKIKELNFNLIVSRDLASKIAKDEKKFYSALYSKYAKEDKKQNACKDFIL